MHFGRIMILWSSTWSMNLGLLTSGRTSLSPRKMFQLLDDLVHSTFIVLVVVHWKPFNRNFLSFTALRSITGLTMQVWSLWPCTQSSKLSTNTSLLPQTWWCCNPYWVISIMCVPCNRWFYYFNIINYNLQCNRCLIYEEKSLYRSLEWEAWQSTWNMPCSNCKHSRTFKLV